MSALSRYQALIEGFARVRAVVLGDLIADEFIYGRIDRVSREAPVLILSYDSTEVVPGGAGNAANNVAALGASVSLVSAVASDGVGDRLVDALPRGAAAGIIRSKRAITPVKTRILAGGVHSAKQQVVRIDRAAEAPPTDVLRQIERSLLKAARTADVVIISDYGLGCVTPDLWNRWRDSIHGVKAPPIVVIDSRYRLAEYRGMTACTPNESELEALFHVQVNDDRDVLEQSGRELLSRLECEAVLVTRGGRGMSLFEPDRPTDHIPIVGSDEVADVTGAGDTVIAVFSVALAAGATKAEAARLANHAGGLVVMKRGTATVSAAELLAAVERSGT